jgi:thiol-disulfide isomerase/thioredoxin
MVDQKQSVVTPQRFEQGLTFEQYLSEIKSNVEKFRFNYENTQVPEDEKKELQQLVAKPNGPKKLVVLGEDWCPDVYRGMGVLARLAEAAGIEMRVFPRDQNLDIMNEFLKDGEFQSIPTAIFYTGDMDYIYHFIERPQQANAEMGKMREIYAGRTREEAQPDIDAFQKGPVWGGWRQATITEILESLKQRVG